jgi:mRNA-degrading endonuclease toxin of MazEF toxin-antitoxin module
MLVSGTPLTGREHTAARGFATISSFDGNATYRHLVQCVCTNGFTAREIAAAHAIELLRECTQRGPQSFFQGRMIERHSQELLNGRALLDCEGEEMSEMLAMRRTKLGAQQLATAA